MYFRIEIEEGKHFVTARLVHYTEEILLEASTREWALRKHLYSDTDTQAYILLAKVFAERCLETGIMNFKCFSVPEHEKTKVNINRFKYILSGISF